LATIASVKDGEKRGRKGKALVDPMQLTTNARPTNDRIGLHDASRGACSSDVAGRNYLDLLLNGEDAAWSAWCVEAAHPDIRAV